MTKCVACSFSQNRSDAKYCGRCGARLTFLTAGDVLKDGRYEIVRVLGKGGMGAVCLAKDRQAFDNQCVIKEMTYYFDPTDADEVRKAQKRFEDEARTLAQLHHQAIPDVRDYFSEAGRNYIVMEYIEGEDLEEKLKKKGDLLPTKEVVQYGIRVCRVLEYLSVQNPPLVHHDIKPANIVVSQDADSASLVDFGTAKVRLVQAGGKLGKKQSSVYGTVGYAPPEQYGEEPTTEPRSDVYALGVTMYRLLTGDDPSDHPMAFPKLHTLPANIQSVLERALKTKVEERPTAPELRGDLEEVLTSELRDEKSSTTPPVERSRARSTLKTLGSLAFVIAGGSFLSWVASGLIGQAAAYGISQILAVALIGLGILLVLIAAVLIGSGLGGAGGFSKLGFLGGLILSIPIIGYAFLSMLAQFCSLRWAVGEPAAYLGVTVIAFMPLLLLDSFRRLRKANHNRLAFLIPLLLIAVLAWLGAESPAMWSEATTFRWPGDELPLLHFDSGSQGPGVYLGRGRDLVVPYVAISRVSMRRVATMVEVSAVTLDPYIPHVWRDLLFPATASRSRFASSGSNLAVREQNCTCPCPFR